MADTVSLTFPDGSVREYRRRRRPAATRRGDFEVARQEGGRLSRSTASCATSPTRLRTARLEIVTRDDPRALELIRYDAAHVLAEAVQELWPGTQVTIGPVIENGFYYDFATQRGAFTPDDLPIIENEDEGRSSGATSRSPRRSGRARRRKRSFADKGEALQGRAGRCYPRRPGPRRSTTRATGSTSAAARTWRPPARSATAFKLMKVAGAYWRGDSQQPDADPHLRHRLGYDQDELDTYLNMLEEAEKRDHRRLGREMDLFHFQEEGPGVVFWHAKGWRHVPEPGVLHAPPARRPRLPGGERAAGAGQVAVGDLGPLGLVQRQHVQGDVGRRRRPDDDRVFALKPMNCPGHVQIFKHGRVLPQELPVRLAEFGNVHRYDTYAQGRPQLGWYGL